MTDNVTGNVTGNATGDAPGEPYDYKAAHASGPGDRPTGDAQRWAAVDEYFSGAFGTSDDALEAALEASQSAGLPNISVSPHQGKLLNLLARIHKARKVLEIGTLGGYSTIWLARALPADGQVITLEIDPEHAAVATANVANAGLADKVEVRLGRAVETLEKLDAEGAGPFDLVFIDADKPSNPEYFAWALKFSRPGTVIIVDNVARGGAVADPDSADPNVIGVRTLADAIAAEPRVSATVVQTVGSKGYDGFALLVVE